MNPWIDPPEQFDAFDEGASIVTPAMGSSAIVLSFTVPSQYRGVVKGLTHYVAGPAIQQGAGDLVWRIRRDRTYVRNYGNLTIEFGDPRESRETYGILLAPGQRFIYEVQNVAYGSVGTRIVCQAKGWYWPISLKV